MIKQEESCGIIPLQKISETWMVFIVQHKSGYWGFPKGHIEPGETQRQTASRELFEETGLHIEKYLPVPALHISYQFRSYGSIVEKSVTFFTAIVYGKLKVCMREIAHAEWIALDQVCNKVKFQNLEQLITQIQASHLDKN